MVIMAALISCVCSRSPFGLSNFANSRSLAMRNSVRAKNVNIHTGTTATTAIDIFSIRNARMRAMPHRDLDCRAMPIPGLWDWRNNHLGKSSLLGLQLLPPTINLAGADIGLSGYVGNDCSRRERRTHERLLLLLTPPSASLNATDNLNLCHSIVSSCAANTSASSGAKENQISPQNGRWPSAPTGFTHFLRHLPRANLLSWHQSE